MRSNLWEVVVTTLWTTFAHCAMEIPLSCTEVGMEIDIDRGVEARRYDHGEGSNKKEGHNQQRDGFIRPIPQRRSSTSRYQTVFLRYNYSFPNYGHKDVHCKYYEGNIHGRNIKQTYLAPWNVEFYKYHTYGHIARNCRSFISISTRQEHPKVRKRKY